MGRGVGIAVASHARRARSAVARPASPPRAASSSGVVSLKVPADRPPGPVSSLRARHESNETGEWRASGERRRTEAASGVSSHLVHELVDDDEVVADRLLVELAEVVLEDLHEPIEVPATTTTRRKTKTTGVEDERGKRPFEDERRTRRGNDRRVVAATRGEAGQPSSSSSSSSQRGPSPRRRWTTRVSLASTRRPTSAEPARRDRGRCPLSAMSDRERRSRPSRRVAAPHPPTPPRLRMPRGRWRGARRPAPSCARSFFDR